MPLGATSPSALREARLQMHWAAQVVSALGKSFVAPQTDDSHPNLGYVADGGLLMGRTTDTAPRFCAALSIPAAKFMLLDDERACIDELLIDGVTLDEAYAWLEHAVKTHGNGTVTGPLDRTLYDIPKHPIGEGKPFRKPDDSTLAELRAWYHDADLILRTFASETDGVSSVRIWPHHFDIGALVVLDKGDNSETARSVGVGMTPGDDYYDEPYFYVNPSPRPAGDEFPMLHGGGVWHQHDWFGAVLTGSALVSVPSERQRDTAAEYLRRSFETATNLLTT